MHVGKTGHFGGTVEFVGAVHFVGTAECSETEKSGSIVECFVVEFVVDYLGLSATLVHNLRHREIHNLLGDSEKFSPQWGNHTAGILEAGVSLRLVVPVPFWVSFSFSWPVSMQVLVHRQKIPALQPEVLRHDNY